MHCVQHDSTVLIGQQSCFRIYPHGFRLIMGYRLRSKLVKYNKTKFTSIRTILRRVSVLKVQLSVIAIVLNSAIIVVLGFLKIYF